MYEQMNRNKIFEAVQERKSELNKCLEMTQDRLQEAPEGFLKISRTKKVAILQSK